MEAERRGEQENRRPDRKDGAIVEDTVDGESGCGVGVETCSQLGTAMSERHQERSARVKAVLNAAGLPVMPNDTHIVPLFVGDPEKCKRATDLLLTEHGIYIQPINYPTVAKGTERLRITPTPYHEDALIYALAEALLEVWERLKLPLKSRVLAAE